MNRFLPLILILSGLLLLALYLIYSLDRENGERQQVNISNDSSTEDPPRLEKQIPTHSHEKKTTVSQESPQVNQQAKNRFTLFFKNWKKIILSSNQPDDQLLAAIFSKDPLKKEMHLLQAYGTDPNNILINLHIMRYCNLNNRSSLCELDVVNFLTQEIGDNSNFQTEIATGHYKNGNKDLALLSLKRAQKGEVADDYQLLYIKAVADSFSRYGAEKGFRSFSELTAVVATIKWADYTQTFPNMCAQEIQHSTPGWQKACLGSAITISQQSKSSLWRTMANHLKFKFSKNSSQADMDIWRQQANLHKEKIRLMSDSSRELTNYFMANLPTEKPNDSATSENRINADIHIPEDIWQRYLSIYSKQGESEAHTWLFTSMLDQEIVGLSED